MVAPAIHLVMVEIMVEAVCHLVMVEIMVAEMVEAAVLLPLLVATSEVSQPLSPLMDTPTEEETLKYFTL
jgi:hypothetical protein